MQPVEPDGNAKGASFMALDSVDAGEGDLVIVVQEGIERARKIFNCLRHVVTLLNRTLELIDLGFV